MCDPVSASIIIGSVVMAGATAYQTSEQASSARRTRNMQETQGKQAQSAAEAQERAIKEAPRKVEPADSELRRRNVAAMRMGLAKTIKTGGGGLGSPAPVATPGLTGGKTALGQ